MKYFTLLAMTLTMMASCTIETGIEITPETSVDFIGTYEMRLDCTGDLSDAEGETLIIMISEKVGSSAYLIDLGDDVIFEGTVDGSTLDIHRQVFNEGGDFDVVTLEGQIVVEDGEYTFDFEHEVDDEGMSICQSVLIKQ